MMSPEFRQLTIDQLPVETKRALEYARTIANENNTNIGLIELYIGVCQEMGALHVQTTLEKNRIKKAGLENEIPIKAALEAHYGDSEKRNPNQPSHLTGLSQSALTNAIRISVERRANINPPSPSPSDLLQGIAKLVLNR